MTIPVRLRGKGYYTDNDEPERRRAHGIDQLKKSYAEGGAYNEFGPKPDAAKDYDLLNRMKPRRSPEIETLRKIVTGYSEKVRKKGKR